MLSIPLHMTAPSFTDLPPSPSPYYLCSYAPDHCPLLVLGHAPTRHDAIVKEEYIRPGLIIVALQIIDVETVL